MSLIFISVIFTTTLQPPNKNNLFICFDRNPYFNIILDTFVQQQFKRGKTTFILIIMLIVGQVSDKEEAKEISFIAKLFVVGARARELAKEKK
jgi:hypothetical protein